MGTRPSPPPLSSAAKATSRRWGLALRGGWGLAIRFTFGTYFNPALTAGFYTRLPKADLEQGIKTAQICRPSEHLPWYHVLSSRLSVYAHHGSLAGLRDRKTFGHLTPIFIRISLSFCVVPNGKRSNGLVPITDRYNGQRMGLPLARTMLRHGTYLYCTVRVYEYI